MTRLKPSNAIGSYPDREEFQVGRVIVWVEIPPHGSRATWLERADRMFGEVWRAIPAVVSAAQRESRALIPEYWKAHDEAGSTGERLAAWGIWIDPLGGTATYEVGRNWDFDPKDPTRLPELPDGHCITVSRDPGSELMARG